MSSTLIARIGTLQRFIFTVALLSIAPSMLVAQTQPRDSAGIKIYDYRAVVPVAWFTVSESPVVKFSGSVSDSSDVSGTTTIAPLKDGRVAVGISQSNVDRAINRSLRFYAAGVRIFDASGKFLNQISRYGTGPDETMGAVNIKQLSNGNLLIGGTVSGYKEFTLDGKLVRHVSPDVVLGSVVGAFNDGSVLVRRKTAPVAVYPEVNLDSARLMEEFSSYARISRDAKATTQLPFFTREYAFGNLPNSSNPIYWSPFPVRTQTPARLDNDVIWLFDSRDWELRVFDPRGALRVIVRLPLPARLQGAQFATLRYTRDSYETTTVVDDLGRLWLESGDSPFRSPFDVSERTWCVFEPGGKMLGTVQLPAGFRLMTVAGDELWGTERLSPASPPLVSAWRLLPPR